jgi:2'-5' RNA ligase
MARLRTFVAVESTDEIQLAAERLIRQLSSVSQGVRWVAPANIHLTLKFLGDVDEREVYRVCQSVAKAAAADEPFQVLCRGTGAFPSPQRPRTIWMGVDDHQERLAGLQRRIEEELETLGFPGDSRQFHGHLTLGRIRYNRQDVEELSQALQGRADVEFGWLPLDEVVVFASELAAGGPRYTALGRCSLTGPAATKQQPHPTDRRDAE